MPLDKSLFLNSFQKGSSESANMGFGAFVGVETYSKKGVAQLTKDSTKVSGSIVTDLPIYFTEGAGLVFTQGDTGKVYKSSNSGVTWVDITDSNISPGGGKGRGLIFYQGYLFAFFNGGIYYCSSAYTSSDWSMVWQTGLTSGQNFPFLFPNDGNIYFGNGHKVGKIGFGTAPTFNPGGSAGTDYFYSASYGRATGILPDCYQINCISFLPTNYLMLGTGHRVLQQIIKSQTLSLGIQHSQPMKPHYASFHRQEQVQEVSNR